MKTKNSNIIVCISCFLTISLILSNALTYGARSDVEAFVTRFYQQCLGRNPDQAGLDGWVNALLNGSLSGADVANGFIFSEEFINLNTTSEDFLIILYRAFFNREPDAAGYQGWLTYMNNGNSRQGALDGFIYSQEFSNLCFSYGINPYPGSTSGSDTVFTSHFFDRNKVSHITPLGELNGGYNEVETFGSIMVNIKSSVIDGGGKLEIYAPSSMTLNAYAYYQFGSDNPEWTLIFTVNSEITIRMTHITEVVSKITDGTTTIPQNSSAEYPPNKTVTFAAGEQIGATTGTSQAHNWNIYVYDTRNENQYARQDRYTADHLGQRLRNAVCPFDYYSSEVMSEYYALLGASAPGQSSTCGTVSRDVAGTLAGQWHFNPDPGTGIYPPALEGVYVSPMAIYTTSDGKVNLYQIDQKRRQISSEHPTYKDPETITTTHCYELTDIFYNTPAGYAYFKIVSGYEMEVSYNPSETCPDTFPSSGGRKYYR